MISKCPECGRSYPSHHGDICKMCASKKAKAIEDANKPKEEVKPQEVKIPTPSVTQKPAPSSHKVTHKKEEEESIFFKNEKKDEAKKDEDFVNLAAMATAPVSAAASAIADKSKMVYDICPKCHSPNATVDLFCVICGKMLIVSAEKDEQDLIDYPLSQIKGIVPDQVASLKKEGIDTTLKLLDKGYTPTKRKTISTKTNIPEILIYRLVNQCDLLRVNGVDPISAYMLDLISIGTLKGLEKKTSKDIVALITQKKSMLYSKQIIVLPEEKTISKWVESAKKIQKVVT